jgi:uncharacterized protein
MAVSLSPRTLRSIGAGTAAAAVLIGAFALGVSRGSASSADPGSAVTQAGVQLTSAASGARITVTGNGVVSGTPNQLTLNMGVQVNATSVDSALQQANQAASQVISALRGQGVAASDIQTSGLYVQPNYGSTYGPNAAPTGYGASESLTATLNNISAAGAQIQAAVHAGGNAVTVDGVSLNLTDTSGLMATARARAVADARTKAAQYAQALGQPLGPVVSISDQTQAPSEPLPMAANASAGKASSVPINPGSQQLTVSVTVVFALA